MSAFARWLPVRPLLALAWALAAAPLLAGCNSVTGADGLAVYAGAGGGSEGSAGPAAAGVGVGASSSTGMVMSKCAYPTKDLGKTVGTVVAETVWQGYAEGSTTIGPVDLKDYNDCDGSLGINAILLDSSATWCGACKQEAMDFPTNEAAWKKAGIRVITLMVQNLQSNPASTSTALDWLNEFHLTGEAVVADPAFTFATGGTIGLPYQIVVDPRTMKIVDIQQGYSGTYGALESLATKNQGH